MSCTPRTPRIGAVVLAAVAAWAGVRAAAAQTESIVVDYTAPDGCPAATAFRQEIRARTARAEIVPGRDEVRRFEASIGQDGEQWVGRLVTTQADGKSDNREVVGDRCEDAAHALALIIAMAVDPRASTAPVPAFSGAPPELGAPPSAAPQSQPPAPSISAGAPPPARAPVSAAKWRWSASAEAQGLGGVAPSALLGPSLSGDASLAGANGLAPSFRAGMAYADDAVAGGSGRDAAFRRYALLLEGCPLRWEPFESLVLRPCAMLEGGVMQASGRHVALPRTQSRVWAATGLGARIRWPDARTWFVEADGAALVPLGRKVFVFDDPRVVVYETPRLAWRAGFGGGIYFW